MWNRINRTGHYMFPRQAQNLDRQDAGWLTCLALLLGVVLAGRGLAQVADPLLVEPSAGDAASAAASTPVTMALQRMGDDLRYLSSDELAGRDVGSPGIVKASNFIAGRFADLGLQTDSFNGTPFQDFTISQLVELGAAERNTLTIRNESGGESTWTLGEHFMPLALGSSGSFTGPLVFAGYGITAPELAYDDYAGLDVAGKVVVILRKQPGQRDPNGKFGSRSSQYAYFSSKELNAALHRAAALIIVNDSVTVESNGGDQLLDVRGAGSAVSDSRIPTLFCLREPVDALLQSSLGKSLVELEAAIDSDLQPRSAALPGLIAAGQTEFVATRVRNVIGYLPGEGALAAETVVVGAHYDHVGMGGVGSLAPGTVAIHNGADDNGSGTTMLLEIARRLVETAGGEVQPSGETQPAADQADASGDATLGKTPSSVPKALGGRRGIVFAAFTGEERGLLGSDHYVRNPRWALENTVAMVNMDMVGRLRNNALTIYGTGTAVGFDALPDRFNQLLGLTLLKEPAGFGPSDHSSFYNVGIPVYHFFTGLHNDYHRPSDDFEKVNLEGMARIATLVTSIVQELATVPQRPAAIRSAAVARIDGMGQQIRDAREGSGRAMLGIQLPRGRDAAEVAGLSSGGPAEQAGLKAGDTIVAIDEQPLRTARELVDYLATKQPGDNVRMEIARGEQRLILTVTLSAR